MFIAPMTQPNNSSIATSRRASRGIAFRAGTSSRTAENVRRRKTVLTGPIVSNRRIATAAPSWIDTIDTSSNAGGGTDASARVIRRPPKRPPEASVVDVALLGAVIGPWCPRTRRKVARLRAADLRWRVEQGELGRIRRLE